MNISNQKEIVVLADLELRVLLPLVPPMADAGAEHLGKADAAALPEPLRRICRVEGADKLAPVLRVDILSGVFLYQAPDVQPVGELVLPCVRVYLEIYTIHLTF